MYYVDKSKKGKWPKLTLPEVFHHGSWLYEMKSVIILTPQHFWTFIAMM